MSDLPNSVETTRRDDGQQIRPATASGLIYKAYKRPYGSGPSQVLNLFASGYYDDAPWDIWFQPIPGRPGHYQLLEEVPSIVYFIVSYYTASYSSQVGLADLGDSVTIHDAHGAHEVKVEPLL
ncbi:MAG: hypothetical protein AAGC60_05945 [Acidobacteriota bacterium]